MEYLPIVPSNYGYMAVNVPIFVEAIESDVRDCFNKIEEAVNAITVKTTSSSGKTTYQYFKNGESIGDFEIDHNLKFRPFKIKSNLIDMFGTILDKNSAHCYVSYVDDLVERDYIIKFGYNTRTILNTTSTPEKEDEDDLW